MLLNISPIPASPHPFPHTPHSYYYYYCYYNNNMFSMKTVLILLLAMLVAASSASSDESPRGLLRAGTTPSWLCFMGHGRPWAHVRRC